MLWRYWLVWRFYGEMALVMICLEGGRAADQWPQCPSACVAISLNPHFKAHIKYVKILQPSVCDFVLTGQLKVQEKLLTHRHSCRTKVWHAALRTELRWHSTHSVSDGRWSGVPVNKSQCCPTIQLGGTSRAVYYVMHKMKSLGSGRPPPPPRQCSPCTDLVWAGIYHLIYLSRKISLSFTRFVEFCQSLYVVAPQFLHKLLAKRECLTGRRLAIVR